MPSSAWLLLLLLLLISSLAPVNGDNQIGYFVPSGKTEALVAQCNDFTAASERWSSVGTAGVCVETADSRSEGTMTTYYYQGQACNGTSVTGIYLASADTRTVTVSVSFGCNRACATVTVFASSPSASPALSYIGCPEQIGLPADARTVYAVLPSGITAAPVARSSTSSPTRTTSSTPISSTPTSSMSSSESSQSPNPDTGSASPNSTPVIVGSVVGSVGGIALILLAFVLGQRYAAKRRTAATAGTANTNPAGGPYEGKPELEGTGPANVEPQQAVPWSQAGWGQHQQSQFSPATSELPPNYPAAHQLPAERGPYEVPGSYEYHPYQTGTEPTQDYPPSSHVQH